MLNKKHFNWVDQLRTVAMTLVVISHGCDYFIIEHPGFHPLWYSFITCLSTISVPTFFLISGFLVAIRGGESRKQIRRISWPFIFWTIVFWIALIVFYGTDAFSGPMLFETITGNRHLYFIFSLIQLHFLYSILFLSIDKNKVYSLVFIYGCFTFIIYGAGDILSWTSLIQTNNGVQSYETYLSRFGLTWALFYFLGVFFAYRQESFKGFAVSNKGLGCATFFFFILFLAEYLVLGTIQGGHSRKYLHLLGLMYQLFGSLFLFTFFYNLRNKNNKFLDWLAEEGKYTFGIYLAHPLCIIFLIKLLAPLKIDVSWGLPLAIILSYISWVSSKYLTIFYRFLVHQIKIRSINQSLRLTK